MLTTDLSNKIKSGSEFLRCGSMEHLVRGILGSLNHLLIT